jgi:hypothetical protein
VTADTDGDEDENEDKVAAAGTREQRMGTWAAVEEAAAVAAVAAVAAAGRPRFLPAPDSAASATADGDAAKV